MAALNQRLADMCVKQAFAALTTSARARPFYANTPAASLTTKPLVPSRTARRHTAWLPPHQCRYDETIAWSTDLPLTAGHLRAVAYLQSAFRKSTKQPCGSDCDQADGEIAGHAECQIFGIPGDAILLSAPAE
jgi:hypothetical protein